MVLTNEHLVNCMPALPISVRNPYPSDPKQDQFLHSILNVKTTFTMYIIKVTHHEQCRYDLDFHFTKYCFTSLAG